MKETKAEIQKELDHEHNQKLEAEEAYERLKEEMIKKELQDTKIQHELQSRIDSLEQEKQNLQIKLARASETFENSDQGQREKQQTYEEMLQEAKRAYI
mmetsp:Transcript_31066/g.30519  ORF Transcript_31066/g.30519 Transcript_31066/m.30519 type:complete len:99 (+) Transcript_31066:232-528(+)